MAKELWESLRGARRIELFAALTLVALLALLLFGSAGDGEDPKTDLEARVERILSRMEGVGRVSAMIAQGADGSATGAVIVAEGLRDIGAYLRLQRAVSALLELEIDRIEIIGSGEVFGGAL